MPEPRRLFCVHCSPEDYDTLMRASATLAQRTGLPRGRALAELLGKFARTRPSDSPEANRARTEAARAARAAQAATKRAAKAEPAAEPTPTNAA